MTVPCITDPDVQAVLDRYPSPVRDTLISLRDVVFAATATHPKSGALVETLKWGQISYHPKKPRVGTTIRIDAARDPQHVATVFFHCQTRLLETFRDRYPDTFHYTGNRAIELTPDWHTHCTELQHCLSLALTYHLWK